MSRLLAAADSLAEALRAPEPQLDEVAFAIAALDPQPANFSDAAATLDAWAARVVRRAAGGAPGLEEVRTVLGEENDLRGDPDNYDAPENSFLPRVLERRRGLPILLSVVWMEVGRRAGVTVHGVALPGHFVVGFPSEAGPLTLVDPFAGGALLGPREVVALTTRAGAAFRPDTLQPAPVRAIAVRMLRNLVGSYLRRRRTEEARSAVTLWLAAAPDDPGAIELFEQLDREAETIWS